MRKDQPAELLADADIATSVSVRIPVELAIWLRDRSRRVGVSVSTIVRDAIWAEKLAEEQAGA
jgi:hypothetical protein